MTNYRRTACFAPLLALLVLLLAIAATSTTAAEFDSRTKNNGVSWTVATGDYLLQRLQCQTPRLLVSLIRSATEAQIAYASCSSCAPGAQRPVTTRITVKRTTTKRVTRIVKKTVTVTASAPGPVKLFEREREQLVERSEVEFENEAEVEPAVISSGHDATSHVYNEVTQECTLYAEGIWSTSVSLNATGTEWVLGVVNSTCPTPTFMPPRMRLFE